MATRFDVIDVELDEVVTEAAHGKKFIPNEAIRLSAV